MKKFFALLLILLLVFSCTACAPKSQDTEETTAHTHSHTHSQEPTVEPSSQIASDNTQNTTQEETQAQTVPEQTEQNTQTEASQPAQNNTSDLCRGTINNNTYKSSFTSLEFTKPADWKFLSDEELALKIGVSTQELAEDIFPSTADRVPAVYDMWATNPQSNINICVAYENMYVTASTSMTTDEYMEMIEGAFENTKGTTLINKSTVELSGQMYQKAVFTTDTGGTSTQSIYYIRAMGKFINLVLVTAPANTELPDIEKMFD